MDLELIFSAAGLLSMVGWATLLVSPLITKWSDRIAGLIVPIIISIGYVGLAFLPNENGGGFGNFDEVTQLFSNPTAIMAGWVHFLAFDLLIGAWICRTGRRENITFWIVLPTLPLTFMFGPAGFLAFSLIRGANNVKKQSKALP
ncbi:MAG: ABA4-like family protein [Pseudomonadota bacterium]